MKHAQVAKCCAQPSRLTKFKAETRDASKCVWSFYLRKLLMGWTGVYHKRRVLQLHLKYHCKQT